MANFEFGFPFKPYSIQVDFMKELYGVLNERKIGLFESPTGTGKSLSLICASLYWLKENQEKEKSKLSVQSTKLDENLRKLDDEKEYGAGDWVAVHSRKKEYMSEKENVKHLLDIITKKEERSEYFKQRRLTGRKLNAKGRAALNVKRKHNESKGDDELATADDLDLVTYDSDEDVDAENKPEDDVKNDEEQSRIKPKIYYCSRTHSQLAQFVNEIKRTKYAEGLRLVTLGSRANLCVNSEVNKTSNVNVLNDRCLEMQKNSSKKKKCSYMKATGLTELRDDILSDILDIEEAATNGKLTSSCSYYASRLAIPEAEIIILPYNILLHKKTRTSYGINLSDSVIIVDEAHNLLETIASVHSSSLFLEQLRTCSSQLNLYMERYKSRLSPKNLSYIEQMILFVKSMASFLWSEKKDDKKSHEILTVMDLKLVAGIENLNLFKLLDHCEKSQIARKLFGFSTSAYYKKLDPSDLTDSSRPVVSSPLAKPLTSSQPTMGINALLSRMTKQRQPKKRKTPVNEVVPVSSNLSIENKGTKEDGEPPKPSSPLYQVLEFIKCLNNPSADGRVLVTRNVQSPAMCSMKYLLLNPSNQFKEILTECHSVILAGGTMRPFSEFTDLLFKPAGVSSERIVTFSCGHVIPEGNLLSISMSHGPSTNGPKLEFSYSQRMNEQVIEETGRTLSKLASAVPGGIVVFFASYDYEQKVYSQWERNGLIEQLQEKGKRVFREPRKSNQVNQVLIEYARTIRMAKTSERNNGAFLFSVVGGKMSEGINFSNELGRCVVMVGLPYGNIMSPELREKMNYLDKEQGHGKGRFYYENLCMKSVNQSIGRAIRHKDDYSVILLLDHRYCCRQDIKNALPRWIGDKLRIEQKFEHVLDAIMKFFADKS